jgi:hypothetical protein
VAAVLVLLLGEIYELHLVMVLCGMKYVPSFMKAGTDVQEILRFCISNFRGCNIGHTDGRDLSSMK